MDPLRAMEDWHGFFTTGQAHDVDYDDKAIAREVRARRWHRLRRGYFVFGDTWAGLDDEGRHRRLSLAVQHSLGTVVALSHVSGALAHGLSVWGHDLSRVHVTRLDGGAGRVEGDVVHHEGVCLEDDVLEHEGRRVLTPQRCVLEAGSRTHDRAARLVPLDSMLWHGRATRDELERQFERMQRWPGMRSMHVPVRLADAGAQSPGETLGRHLFWAAHLPRPRTQYEVRDARGGLIGTCDWGWPEHGLLGEFDGRVKYGRLLAPGQEPGDVVFAEKRREDRMREATGFGMVRLVWDDFDRPRLTAARVRRGLGLGG